MQHTWNNLKQKCVLTKTGSLDLETNILWSIKKRFRIVKLGLKNTMKTVKNNYNAVLKVLEVHKRLNNTFTEKAGSFLHQSICNWSVIFRNLLQKSPLQVVTSLRYSKTTITSCWSNSFPFNFHIPQSSNRFSVHS